MKRILAIVLVVVLAGGGWFGWQKLSPAEPPPASAPDVYQVVRGPLDVRIVESASLRAERSVNLRSELEGKSAITWVIAEGSTVQKGDKLVVLETNEIREKEENQQINVARSEADHAAAETDVQIQESKNASDISKAEDQVIFARLDLDKFLGTVLDTAKILSSGTGSENGEHPVSETVSAPPPPPSSSPPTAEVSAPAVEPTGAAPSDTDLPPPAAAIAQAAQDELAPDEEIERLGEKEQLITKAQSDVDLARDEVDRARRRLKWTNALHERKYVSDDELETDRLALQRGENSLRHARNTLFILENYTLVRQEKDLRAKLALAEAELERVKLRCTAELVQKKAVVGSRKQQLEMERTKLQKYRKQIEAATILAPSPGIVVYAQFWDQNGPAVPKEGLEVRQGQQLIVLPDLSSMIAQCKVHEAQMDRVAKGQRVTVRMDSMRDQVFTGEVTRVGVLPDNEDGWMGPENKMYATTISLEGDTTMLRPGQSASAEIHVAHLEDVISVPVQSVHRRGRVTYVWRLDGETASAQPVKTGTTNDKFVEIVEGVREGERIALAPPSGVREPEFPDLEKKLEEEEKERAAQAAAEAKAKAEREAANGEKEGEAEAENGKDKKADEPKKAPHGEKKPAESKPSPGAVTTSAASATGSASPTTLGVFPDGSR